MSAIAARSLLSTIHAEAHPLRGDASDFDPLLARVGDARLVLIGEASHGTHEFYRIRGEITKRLIREHGFNAIAVEADWPDAYRINRFVRAAGDDADATEALGGFRRFPQWMWRNADVLDFVGWLRAHNESRPQAAQAGFYGLDLYSMHTSIEAVLSYLRLVDPDAAQRAQARYSCFDHFGEDLQAYGYSSSMGLSASCEDECVQQLMDLRQHGTEYAGRDGQLAADDQFYAEENARLVANAERYYRSMFRGRQSSWNLRDQHMAEVLEALGKFLARSGTPPRIVLWAHNSHLGDARATEMGRRGELNLGQLVRQRHGRHAVLVGCTTYSGTVTAAEDWDMPAVRMDVRPALQGSYEALLHEAGGDLLLMLGAGPLGDALAEPRIERAIGVVYRPGTERLSHYFDASLSHQFDAVLHYDHTRAVEPLERTGSESPGEVPETYPSAL